MKRITLLIRKHENLTVKVFFVLLLFIYSLRLLCYRNELYILHDEFGYWAIAAKYAGYEWTDLMQNSAYYSYVYSLLLVPLFWLKASAAVMYKAAIIINALLIIFSYLVSCKVADRLFPEINKKILHVICGIIPFYMYVALNVNYAWPEILLYFSFWLLVYFVIRIVDKNDILSNVSMLIFCIIIYFIHQRALGVFIAAILVYLFKAYLEHKNIRSFFRINKKKFVYLLVIPVIFFIGIQIKKYNLENIFSENEIVDINNFSGQVHKINQIFSLDGILNFIIGFLGKLFYLNVATFSIGGFGVFILFHRVIGKIKKWIVQKKDINNETIIELFILLSFLGSFFITVIATLVKWNVKPVNVRADILLYGRYFEFVLGPILLYGLIAMLSVKKNIKLFLMNIIIFIISAIISQDQFMNIDSTGKVDLSASGFNYFYWNTSEYNQVIILGTLSILAVAAILCLVCFAEKKYSLSLYLFLIFLSWGIQNYQNDKIIIEREKLNEKYVYDTIEYLDSNSEQYNLYYVSNKGQLDIQGRFVYYMQYNKYSKMIDCIQLEDLDIQKFRLKEGNIYIVLDEGIKEEFMIKGKLLYTNGIINLFSI